MKKIKIRGFDSRKLNLIATIIAIAIVFILSIALLCRGSDNVNKEVAECIGQNSVLYIQLGCHACKIQEDVFGKDYQYLNVVDCWTERDRCNDANIEATPTWVIDGKKYRGVQTIEQLKDLTGC